MQSRDSRSAIAFFKGHKVKDSACKLSKKARPLKMPKAEDESSSEKSKRI